MTHNANDIPNERNDMKQNETTTDLHKTGAQSIQTVFWCQHTSTSSVCIVHIPDYQNEQCCSQREYFSANVNEETTSCCLASVRKWLHSSVWYGFWPNQWFAISFTRLSANQLIFIVDKTKWTTVCTHTHSQCNCFCLWYAGTFLLCTLIVSSLFCVILLAYLFRMRLIRWFSQIIRNFIRFT